MTRRYSQDGLFNVIVVGLIGLGILIIGFTGWYVVDNKKKTDSAYNAAGSSEVKLTKGLKIISDPAGIDIAGSPLCDSQKLKKVTPYGCSEAEGQTTTLTAQETVNVNGKSYKFKTWDGCSESNKDKKICKVKVDRGKLKTAKASYELTSSTSTQQAKTPAAPNQDPVCAAKDSSDTNYASCKLVITNVPAKVTFKGDMRATECGKKIAGTLGSKFLAPCPSTEGYYGFSQTFPENAVNVSCTVTGACSVNLAAFFPYIGSISISKSTELSLKVLLQTPHNYVCNHESCYADTTFSKWDASYDASQKTYNISAYYVYEGID